MVPLPRKRADRAVTVCLYFLGALLCFAYLLTSFGPVTMALAATAWTALFVAARTAAWRTLRRSAAALSAVLYVGSIYAAILFTTVLGWSLPAWAIGLVAAASLAAVITGRPGWQRVRIPAVLPLGLLIAAALWGWWREGGSVRCDDFLRAQQQSGVEVIIPSLEQLAACRPGATLPLRRYPRQIWEAPDRRTIVFTTQMEPFPGATQSGFTGAVCVARLRPGSELRCFGDGKGDGMVEMAPHNRLIACSTDALTATGAGHGLPGSALYALQLDDLFAEPAVVSLERAGSALYDPGLDILYVIGQDGKDITQMRGADLQASPPVPLQLILTDYGRYDETRHEGILCGAAGPIGALRNGGRSYVANRLRGVPFEVREISGGLLGWLAFSFGCDWDPESRRAYVAIPNLGVIADVDYDSSRLLGFGVTAFGLRYLRFDPVHRRIYAGDFLRGFAVELDADSKRELRRWFVGRFARDIRVTRDGRALLAATNLGIVRIFL